MGDAKCPMCRGEMVREFDDGSMWWCRVCGNEPFRPDATGEGFKTHAYWEPRDRLPTAEERRALEVKHGHRAGWMVRIKGNEVFDPIRGTLGWADWYHTERLNAGLVESYPHVNGRPVGWP